uniref:CUPID domain-containing protein n=1 Tax=Strongyloides venezuelensis TaxID=75913 RepID=A0A0K0FXH8_STRVS
MDPKNNVKHGSSSYIMTTTPLPYGNSSINSPKNLPSLSTNVSSQNNSKIAYVTKATSVQRTTTAPYNMVAKKNSYIRGGPDEGPTVKEHLQKQSRLNKQKMQAEMNSSNQGTMPEQMVIYNYDNHSLIQQPHPNVVIQGGVRTQKMSITTTKATYIQQAHPSTYNIASQGRSPLKRPGAALSTGDTVNIPQTSSSSSVTTSSGSRMLSKIRKPPPQKIIQTFVSNNPGSYVEPLSSGQVYHHSNSINNYNQENVNSQHLRVPISAPIPTTTHNIITSKPVPPPKTTQRLTSAQLKQKQEDEKYQRKLRLLKKTIKSLVFKNTALCDEVSRLNYRIDTVNDERKVLAKKLQQHERNRIRRIQTVIKKEEAAMVNQSFISSFSNHGGMSSTSLSPTNTRPPSTASSSIGYHNIINNSIPSKNIPSSINISSNNKQIMLHDDNGISNYHTDNCIIIDNQTRPSSANIYHHRRLNSSGGNSGPSDRGPIYFDDTALPIKIESQEV